MTKAAERAVRRHIREKATVDHMAKGVRKSPASAEQPTTQSPTTSDGLPVEGQVRKTWTPNKGGGLPTFWRDPPAFLLCDPLARNRARSRR